MPATQTSLSFVVVRDVAADLTFAFKQVKNAVLVLLQLINVHIVKVAATKTASSLITFLGTGRPANDTYGRIVEVSTLDKFLFEFVPFLLFSLVL